jgi:hypothetical protein
MMQDLESAQNKVQQNEHDKDRRRDTSGNGSQERPPQGHDEPKPPSTGSSDSEHTHYFLVEVVVETESDGERCMETVRYSEQNASREEAERRAKEAFHPKGKIKRIVSIKINGLYDRKPTITPPPQPTCTPIDANSEGSKETTETQSQKKGYVAYYVIPSVSWALEKSYVLDKSDFDKDTRKKEVLGTGATRKDAIRKACSKLHNVRSWRQSACSKVANYGDNTICVDGLDGCRN